ncbi:calsyntenin-2-like [Trichomycterus rosablanca]|uniref:calsyntenin-2-like n=1 Tax=Trichomycterus rosablanca TaxID=2290929 RepID=UPI002F35409A
MRMMRMRMNTIIWITGFKMLLCTWFSSSLIITNIIVTVITTNLEISATEQEENDSSENTTACEKPVTEEGFSLKQENFVHVEELVTRTKMTKSQRPLRTSCLENLTMDTFEELILVMADIDKSIRTFGRSYRYEVYKLSSNQEMEENRITRNKMAMALQESLLINKLTSCHSGDILSTLMTLEKTNFRDFSLDEEPQLFTRVAFLLNMALTALVLIGLFCRGDVLAAKVNKHKPWIETSYHGVITENTDTVLLDPPLVALDKDAPVPYAGDICAFKIHGKDTPFKAKVLNKTSGEGVLRAFGPVDCEQQKEFTFIIQAYDCGADVTGASWKKSHKAMVHIQVEDVNEFAPFFREPKYQATVTEGKIYDSIVQVEAWDQDCSAQYSQICNYEIITPATPFAIDRNGNIRNTEHLNYEKQQLYKIMVSAYDCGQKRATESVFVYIHVKPMCKPGWQGWNKQVDYEPGTGSRQLFPVMHLETCDSPVSSIRVTVELQTSHIGKGCDRETYSEKSLQKLCGAASGSVDLLPTPSASTNWTSTLLTDDGRDSDLIFHFNGRQAANIPEQVAPQNLTEQFTIATWMKHGPSPGLRAEKETLLCNSDKTEMNRHHYSLYVHNCRLVFLLRRDFTQTDTFRPAEFHWKLEQICDEEWHYYVINVEFPAVMLFVDGVTYDPYLVTDDWPIQPSQIDMQLTVGACWQGGEMTSPRFTQFFRGSLSGLTIRPGKIETQKVISCLQACKEGLDINSLESLGKGIKFHFNPAQSVLVMESEDLENINTAVAKVSYINSRQFPTPGLRTLRVSTTIQCFGEDPCISIPDIKAVVMVMVPSKPQISITGAEQVTVPAAELQTSVGVALFKEIHIISTVIKSDGTVSSGSRPGILEVMHNLDYCNVMVIGEELNPEDESLEIHHSSLLGKHLDATNSTSGISIYGVDSMANYEQAIQQVRYRNWRPDRLLQRRFRLSCSELNGRYTSNNFNLEIGIVHISEAIRLVNQMAVQPLYIRPVHHPLVIQTVNSDQISGTALAAIVLIGMSVAALVVIMVLGIYCIHASHLQRLQIKKNEGKEPETVWKDAAITITVNPMENLDNPQSAEETRGQESENDDEDDDKPSRNQFSTESDDNEEEEQTIQKGRLVWEHSTPYY